MPLPAGMRRIPRSHLTINRRPIPRLSPTRSTLRRWVSSTTPFTELPADPGPLLPKGPFRFETGIALFAKRPPRPFPRPFMSMPSMSFSDPLSTFDQSRDRRGHYINGELVRGATNGDDAVFANDYFIGANDGVGAWSTRPRGHAGLWSRLIMHFWVASMEQDILKSRPSDLVYQPDPVAYLSQAYELTVDATSKPIDCQGTTTVCGAQLHHKKSPSGDGDIPVLYVTNLGDSQVMVLRPRDRKILFKTKEQWHWFDCPRQLGTNSPDTPRDNAVVDVVEIEAGDVVLAMSDGVIDNLWEHEIVRLVVDSLVKWEDQKDPLTTRMARMPFAASELMNAAREIALDPFAESPYMEHAIDEGLASSGGKLDDISVVAARCIANE